MSSTTSGQSSDSDHRFAQRPLNGCGRCRADFTSLRLFYAHRVGEHELDWPEHQNGRRCLDAEEMQARGWEQDTASRWLDPTRVMDARRRLRHVAHAQTGPARPEDEAVAA